MLHAIKRLITTHNSPCVKGLWSQPSRASLILKLPHGHREEVLNKWILTQSLDHAHLHCFIFFMTSWPRLFSVKCETRAWLNTQHLEMLAKHDGCAWPQDRCCPVPYARLMFCYCSPCCADVMVCTLMSNSWSFPECLHSVARCFPSLQLLLSHFPGFWLQRRAEKLTASVPVLTVPLPPSLRKNRLF